MKWGASTHSHGLWVVQVLPAYTNRFAVTHWYYNSDTIVSQEQHYSKAGKTYPECDTASTISSLAADTALPKRGSEQNGSTSTENAKTKLGATSEVEAPTPSHLPTIGSSVPNHYPTAMTGASCDFPVLRLSPDEHRFDSDNGTHLECGSLKTQLNEPSAHSHHKSTDSSIPSRPCSNLPSDHFGGENETVPRENAETSANHKSEIGEFSGLSSAYAAIGYESYTLMSGQVSAHGDQCSC